MARLYLLHVHKLDVLESPPIQPLDRKMVGIKPNDVLDSVITLPSGRTIRKLDNGILNVFIHIIFILALLFTYFSSSNEQTYMGSSAKGK